MHQKTEVFQTRKTSVFLDFFTLHGYTYIMGGEYYADGKINIALRSQCVLCFR